MPLAAGTRLGPYEISTPLGHGGMGEVYRARDTRLGREVAVKILPAELTGSAEVRARFEREARTISQLNHPHICVLHDAGRDGDTDYLVMELVEGETLAQRLERGALPIDEALRIGAQIADALDRAHRAGVIHRDLKPGNVMLTRSGAKLMDFGLARATGMVPQGGSGISIGAFSQSPTIAQPLTAEGTIVGTFQYMAPEQLEGKESDARTDLWALGCVLYEMLTGRRAFEGRSQASLISAIMKDTPPPIASLAPMAPPVLDRAVRQCLAKDPDDRWQSAGDLRRELLWIAGQGATSATAEGTARPSSARRRERIAWGLALVSVAIAVALAWPRGPRHESVGPMQLSLLGPEGVTVRPSSEGVAVSPDGSMVAMVCRDSAGGEAIWLQSLATGASRLVPGTGQGDYPFWSPDSRRLGFFAEGKLRVATLATATVENLCDALDGRGGSWSPRGEIVFAPTSAGGLQRVPETGGVPRTATTLDSTRGEGSHRFPRFLPDGRHYLYVTSTPSGLLVRLASLDEPETSELIHGSSPLYAEPGYLLFGRQGNVYAQPFDARRLRVAGPAVALPLQSFVSYSFGAPFGSISAGGVLVRAPNPETRSRFVWLDRRGSPIGDVSLSPAVYGRFRLSPDDRRVAVEVITSGSTLVYDGDLSTGILTRLSRPSGLHLMPTWSADGRNVVYGSGSNEGRNLVISPLGRAEAESVLAKLDGLFNMPNSWSPDGRYLLFRRLHPETQDDVWTLPLEGDRRPRPYLAGPARESDASVSPDGRWVAYVSDESGRRELYVSSYPEADRRVRVSRRGAGYGRRGLGVSFWRADGRALVYLDGDQVTVMEVPVKLGEQFSFGEPHPLFRLAPGMETPTPTSAHDRFLVLVDTEGGSRSVLRVNTDWRGLLPGAR